MVSKLPSGVGERARSLMSRLRGAKELPEAGGDAPETLIVSSDIGPEPKTPGGRKSPRRFLPSLSGKGAAPSKRGDGTGGIGAAEAEYIDAGVVSVGAERFAVSMIWTGRDDDVSIREQARKLARSRSSAGANQPTPNLWVEDRVGNLVGLSDAASTGQKSGMRVLVTSLPEDGTGGRWIGAFRVQGVLDAWWIGSVRDGKVFEDQMVFGRHEAEDLFLSSLEAPDWTSVFAPPEWGVPGALGAQLGELLSPKRGQRLRHVEPVRANMPRIILGGMVIAVAAGGLFAWSDMKARQAAEMERLRQEAQNVLRVRPEDYPWHRAAPIAAFIETCRTEIERSIFLVPGWEAQPISCTGARGAGAINLGWTRTSGRISWLKSGVPPEFPAPVLEGEGDRASFSRTFDMPVDADALSREPWESAMMVARLRERFQSLDLSLSLREKRDEGSRVRRGRDEAVSLRPIFNHHEIQIPIAASPGSYGALLEDVPALVPEALVYNVAADSWSLLAKVYHPPIFPEPN
jgi:hypothetical protein